MKGRVSILAVGLLACSMQALPEPPAANLMIIPDRSPKDAKALPPPRICQLGGDCMAMDTRPFELCQVSARSCGDKLAEVLQVERPKMVVKPAPVLPVSR